MFPLIWQRKIVTVTVQCYANGIDNRHFVKVLATCSEQVLAGRRINFEGLAFASKTILRQNTSDHAVSRLCLPFPLNRSESFGKRSDNPFKGRFVQTDLKLMWSVFAGHLDCGHIVSMFLLHAPGRCSKKTCLFNVPFGRADTV